jgi:hypothetical protein
LFEELREFIEKCTAKFAALRKAVEDIQLKPGPAGLSAYEVWIQGGNEGTEADYLASLQGSPGKDAPVVDEARLAARVLAQVKVPVPRAPPSLQAVASMVLRSIAVPKAKAGEPGPRGPMPDHQWDGSKLRFEKPDGSWGPKVDLQGPKGKDGKGGSGGGAVYVDAGTSGAVIDDENVSAEKTWSSQQISAALSEVSQGAAGLSAYEVWLAEGHEGTEADFLASLRGQDAAAILDEAVNSTTDNTTVAGSSASMVSNSRSGANTFTLPTRTADATLVVRKPYLLRQAGAGTSSVVAGSGATINIRSGLSAAFAGQHAGVTAMLVDDTTWWVFGDLAPT